MPRRGTTYHVTGSRRAGNNATRRAGSSVKRKKAAYKPKRKQAVRNALRPLVETKWRQIDRNISHVVFNGQAAPSVSTTGYLSVNPLVEAKVPKNTSIFIPHAWGNCWDQGNKKDNITGRSITPSYLNMKLECDWTYAHNKAHLDNATDWIDHYYIIQGMCKSTLMKTEFRTSLPSTDGEANTQFSSMVAKALVDAEINGDNLDFPRKNKNVWIMKHFRMKPNLNERYVDVSMENPGDTTVTSHESQYVLPKTYQFSWTLKRKAFLESKDDATKWVMANSWCPFIAIYNKSLVTDRGHDATPKISTASKIYFTDM